MKVVLSKAKHLLVLQGLVKPNINGCLLLPRRPFRGTWPYSILQKIVSSNRTVELDKKQISKPNAVKYEVNTLQAVCLNHQLDKYWGELHLSEGSLVAEFNCNTLQELSYFILHSWSYKVIESIFIYPSPFAKLFGFLVIMANCHLGLNLLWKSRKNSNRRFDENNKRKSSSDGHTLSSMYNRMQSKHTSKADFIGNAVFCQMILLSLVLFLLLSICFSDLDTSMFYCTSTYNCLPGSQT